MILAALRGLGWDDILVQNVRLGSTKHLSVREIPPLEIEIEVGKRYQMVLCVCLISGYHSTILEVEIEVGKRGIVLNDCFSKIDQTNKRQNSLSTCLLIPHLYL